jgi:hypothetical protein
MDVIFIKPREPDPPEPRPKRKHVMTPARLAAARANAQLSTGPKDISNTRFNRLIHGCACELPVVMPGEDPEEVQNKINLYIAEQGAETQAEKDSAAMAALEFVRYQRCHGADIAAGTRVVNDVQNNFEDRQCRRCADLVANLPASPAATVIELCSFTHGISWVLGQVERLEEHLGSSFSLHPDQRVHAIRICGRRPQDLFTDPVVMNWNVNYLSALHGPGKISAAEAAELLETDRPEGMAADLFEFRLEGYLGGLVAMEEGQARLRETLAAVKAQLLDRLAEVEEREAIDRELAVAEAMVSVNDECMKRLRYRRESQRGRQGALRELHQLQVMRLKYGEALGGTGAAVATEAGTAAPAAPPAAAPGTPAAAEKAGQRTEAAAPQVQSGTSGNDEAPRPGGGAVPTAYQCSPQQVAALVANLRRKRASEQKRE